MKTEFQKCMDGEIFDGKDKELAEMTLKTKRLLCCGERFSQVAKTTNITK